MIGKEKKINYCGHYMVWHVVICTSTVCLEGREDFGSLKCKVVLLMEGVTCAAEE